MFFLGLTDQAAPVERPHVVGIKRQRALELGERFFVVAGFGQRLATRCIALGVTDVARAGIVSRFRLGLRLRLFLVAPRTRSCPWGDGFVTNPLLSGH